MMRTKPSKCEFSILISIDIPNIQRILLEYFDPWPSILGGSGSPLDWTVCELFSPRSQMSHIRICLVLIFHRIWWVTAFILSISCCLSLIYSMWQKWVDCPVIVSFDHRPLTISVIPFPATTICPFIKTKSDVFNYTRVYRLLSRLEGVDERTPNETE